MLNVPLQSFLKSGIFIYNNNLYTHSYMVSCIAKEIYWSNKGASPDQSGIGSKGKKE